MNDGDFENGFNTKQAEEESSWKYPSEFRQAVMDLYERTFAVCQVTPETQAAILQVLASNYGADEDRTREAISLHTEEMLAVDRLELSGGGLAFQGLTYAALWKSWEGRDNEALLARLRQRYQLTI